ncbi:MAG: helix-turn-helix domain-containing protein [Salana multivorans]|uniref:helix-turn-helix domain-containing protein n=1 Tax=Salana multivorans TaxID=120377 RepID=UPI0009689868|nr:helix-turn-helix domain-containing protein [Salana multivorans]MBN8883345.1 helix-turn-helix domain-containing protein [Salana multivorans]OJX98431.1 MAG: hypothetical protein BGO96_04525 [Micrococcales bacterium 73-15]
MAGVDELLTVAEVAAELRQSAYTVRLVIRRGDLKAIRVGRSKRGEYRIRRSAFDTYLAERETAAA